MARLGGMGGGRPAPKSKPVSPSVFAGARARAQVTLPGRKPSTPSRPAPSRPASGTNPLTRAVLSITPAVNRAVRQAGPILRQEAYFGTPAGRASLLRQYQGSTFPVRRQLVSLAATAPKSNFSNVILKGLHSEMQRTGQTTKPYSVDEGVRLAKRFAAKDSLQAVGGPLGVYGEALSGALKLGEKYAPQALRSNPNVAGAGPNIGLGERASRLGAVPFSVGRVAVEKPSTVSNAISDIPGMAAAAVAVPVEVGIKTVQGAQKGNPFAGVEDLGKQIGQDYKQRYGPLLDAPTADQGTAAFRKGMMDRGSIAPEALDLLSVTGVGGAVVGRGLGAVAKTGRIGSAAERIMSEPRPLLRVAGGKVKPQNVSPNFFRAAAQRLEDRSRTKAFEKRSAREAAQGGVTGLIPNEGEVVARFKFNQNRSQRKIAGQISASNLLEQKAAQREILWKGAVGNMSQLSKDERRGLFFSVQGLVPETATGFDLAGAARNLRALRSQIVEFRDQRLKEAGASKKPTEAKLAAQFGDKVAAQFRDATDVVQRIDELLNGGLEKTFTPRLMEVSRVERERVGGIHAGITSETAARRAARPQNEIMQSARPTLRDTAETLLPRQAVVDAFDEAATEKALARRERRKGRIIPARKGNFSEFTEAVPTRTLAGMIEYDRKLQPQSERQYAELRKDIENNGIREPVVIEFNPDTGKAFVSEGNTRIAIAQELGINEIPAYVLRSRLRSKGNPSRRVDLAPEKEWANSNEPSGYWVPSILKPSNLGLEAKPVRPIIPRAGQTVRPETSAELLRRAQRKRDKAIIPQDPIEALQAEIAFEKKALRKYAEDPQSVKEISSRIADLEKTLADKRPELSQQFAEEVRRAALDAGLPPDPGYWLHRPRPLDRNSAYTLGAGVKAYHDIHESNLELFRLGLADMRPAAYLQGLANSIKRPYLLRAVTENVDRLALRSPDGLNAFELQNWMTAQGIDPRGYYLIEPERVLRNAEGDVLDRTDGAFTGESELFGERGVGRERLKSRSNVDPFTLIPSDIKTLSGWKAIPKGAGDDLRLAATPSGVSGRVWDKIQGGTSFALLGLNPAWAIAQVAANLFQSLAATRGNLLALARSPFYWQALTPHQQAIFRIRLGAGYRNQTPKLGELGGRMEQVAGLGYWLKAWKEFEGSSTGMKLKSKAPQNLLYHFDNAETAYFKKAVFTNRLAKEAKKAQFRETRQKLNLAVASVERVVNVFRMAPEKQMKAVLDNPQLFEDMVRHVLDSMGDWDNYSARERKFFKRIPLFYGFLRYAFRLGFYVLPVKHPLITLMALQLGRMHVNEVKQIVGGDAKWAYGKVFFDNNGKLSSINMGRINPVYGPLFDLLGSGPRAAAGSFINPLVQAFMDSMYGSNMYTQSPLQVKGSAQSSRDGGPDAWDDPITGARTFANLLGQSVAPYRVAKYLTEGQTPMGDDSLPGLPRPLNYKTKGAETTARKKLISRGTPEQRALQTAVLPFLPLPDTTKDLLAMRNQTKSGKKKSKSKNPAQQLLEDVYGKDATQISKKSSRDVLKGVYGNAIR